MSFLVCSGVDGNVSDGVMRGVDLLALLGWWGVCVSPASFRPLGFGSKVGMGVTPKLLARTRVVGVTWSSRIGDRLERALGGGGNGVVNTRGLWS